METKKPKKDLAGMLIAGIIMCMVVFYIGVNHTRYFGSSKKGTKSKTEEPSQKPVTRWLHEMGVSGKVMTPEEEREALISTLKSMYGENDDIVRMLEADKERQKKIKQQKKRRGIYEEEEVWITIDGEKKKATIKRR